MKINVCDKCYSEGKEVKEELVYKFGLEKGVKLVLCKSCLEEVRSTITPGGFTHYASEIFNNCDARTRLGIKVR